MPCKMTIYYNLFNAGFSETYFHNSDDPQALSNAIPNSFYQKAARFRHSACSVKAARFSRVGGVRQSILKRPYPVAQGASSGLAQQTADVVSTTCVYALQSATGKIRRVWFRGLNDGDVTRDAAGNDVMFGILSGYVDAWISALITAGFCIQVVQRPPAGALTYKKVLAVQPLNPDNATRSMFFTDPNVPPYIVGQKLSFVGIPGTLPRFPRSAEVLFVTVIDGINNYQIAYSLPGGVGINPASMKVTPLLFAYEAIFDWAFERYGEHKTGRPFGSLRGRSRAVSLAR